MTKAKGDNTQIVNAATVWPITRRDLIAGGTAALAVAGAALPSNTLNADAETDPVVTLWRQYRPAEDDARRLGNRIMEIEGELEHPGAALGTVIAIADWRAGKAGLVEVNRQRKDREKAAGLPELRDEEHRLDGISGDLYAQIEKATAITPAGHACKLLIAFEHTERSEWIADLPCCLYVSILRDLLPLCPSDVAAWARAFVDADPDHAHVGGCLDTARGIERSGEACHG
jgi:hypothetical protein